MGKTGKEGLKRRCLAMEPHKLSPAVAGRAKDLLSSLSLDDVRDVSAGAATFYLWVSTGFWVSLFYIVCDARLLSVVSTRFWVSLIYIVCNTHWILGKLVLHCLRCLFVLNSEYSILGELDLHCSQHLFVVNGEYWIPGELDLHTCLFIG